jgi:hypothetical protein
MLHVTACAASSSYRLSRTLDGAHDQSGCLSVEENLFSRLLCQELNCESLVIQGATELFRLRNYFTTVHTNKISKTNSCSRSVVYTCYRLSDRQICVPFP